ncbi:MAG: response regulator [Magnetococcales bacterium]|nr:response regulator [Magnetococcales bacterium]
MDTPGVGQAASEIIFIIQDITVQRLYEERIHQALSVAEAASRSKSEFIANMSHEIRTPINAVIGLSDLALKSDPPPLFEDYLAKINSSSHTLMSLINDILDFSRSESGQLRLDPTEFNLGDLFGRLADMLGGQLLDKPVELIFALPPNYCTILYGDALRLEQVFINLIRNAIKFTERGSILVEAHPIQETTPGTVRLLFSVRDTGIGIAAEHLDRLFEPFVQADGSITRQYGGTGLGLAICKRLTALLGGEIQVESVLGEGSVFRFSVVMACHSQPEDNGRIVPERLRDRKILVVDDSPLFVEMIDQTLSAWSFAVVPAPSGEAAIEAIRTAHVLGKPFDLVLMDWRMPGMDGLEAIRRIRAEWGEQPSIILLTAFGGEGLLRLAHQQGVTQLLRKPITHSQLFDTILGVFGEQTVATRWSERSLLEEVTARAALAGMHLLLVEDNAINQQVAQGLLQRVGVTVTLANHGQEALDRLETTLFDGVLMDVQMPVMDGLEATRQIRRRPHLHALPIIAMTAHALDEARRQCLEAGMNAHLTKPIQPTRLYALLAHWITSRSAPVNPAEVVRPAQPTRPDEETILPAIPGVDKAAGLAHTGGSEAFLQSMLRRFAEQQGQTAAQLQAALAAGRLEEAARIAHSVKGLSGTLGATVLQQAALALEEALRREGQSCPFSYQADFAAALQTILDAVARWPAAPAVASPTLPVDAPLDLVQARALLTELADLVRQHNTETDAVMAALKACLATQETRALWWEVEGHLSRFAAADALQSIDKLFALLADRSGEEGTT